MVRIPTNHGFASTVATRTMMSRPSATSRAATTMNTSGLGWSCRRSYQHGKPRLSGLDLGRVGDQLGLGDRWRRRGGSRAPPGHGVAGAGLPEILGGDGVPW